MNHIEDNLLRLIEKTKNYTFDELSHLSHLKPNRFEQNLKNEFHQLNNNHVYGNNGGYHYNLNSVLIKNENEEEHKKNTLGGKSIIGAGLIMAGQPILKKRFVTNGSAIGTSIASKYLAKAFPQKLPFRVMNTIVLGRAVGRIVPYVGWALLAVDVIELVIEEYGNDNKTKGFFKGFGGGSFGGGGADGSY